MRTAARDGRLASGVRAPRGSAALARLCLSRLRDPRRVLRLADDERATLRPLRSSGLRQPLPKDARPSRAADLGLAPAGEADGRGPCGAPWLELPGLASRGASCTTRRARGRPSGATRPRWRASAASPRRAVPELQRTQGVEPAAEVSARGTPRAGNRRRGPASSCDHGYRARLCLLLHAF
jgi:hypothetical protein